MFRKNCLIRSPKPITQPRFFSTFNTNSLYPSVQFSIALTCSLYGFLNYSEQKFDEHR